MAFNLGFGVVELYLSNFQNGGKHTLAMIGLGFMVENILSANSLQMLENRK